MQFVITCLSRTQRIESDITVLVLSYCDSINLLIYNWIVSICIYSPDLATIHNIVVVFLSCNMILNNYKILQTNPRLKEQRLKQINYC